MKSTIRRLSSSGRFAVRREALTRGSQNAPRIEVCILAGGLSRRMGRDKARVRLGKRTMLARIRVVVKQFGLKARIIRRDLVPRCGPLGGIYTGLRTTPAEAVLFLACDMPFIRRELLMLVIGNGTSGARAFPVFTQGPGGTGFPLLLPKRVADQVDTAIREGRLSLGKLCATLDARKAPVPFALRRQLQNINTAEDLSRARTWLRSQRRNRQDAA